MRTEGNYLSGQGTMESFRDAGIQRYIFRALLETRTCKTCGELDGKDFPVSEQQPGTNMHPMHPQCRCFTVPYRDKETLAKRTRAAQLGADQWGQVPQDMTYQEWYAKYVEGSSKEAGLTQGLSSGKMGDTDDYTTITSVESFDIQDKNAIKTELSDFQDSYKYADREYALVLSPNGSLYRLRGWEASVNTELVGTDALKGSIVYHNHPTTPEEGFRDSFSKLDMEFAARCKPSVSLVVSGDRLQAVRLDENITVEQISKAYEDSKLRVYERPFETDVPIEYLQLEIMRELGNLEGVDFHEL